MGKGNDRKGREITEGDGWIDGWWKDRKASWWTSWHAYFHRLKREGSKCFRKGK